ncbi:MAG TPA: IclR family transcriptional regulator [Corynebacterium sp.]|nr:IclR family transcriptional regulator [Corynebacterium sp.]
MAGNNRVPGRSLLNKVSAVFGVFERQLRPLSLTEIAAGADLPPSSAHRIVGEMVDEELLTQTPDGRYQVSLRMWRMGQTVGQQLRETANPYVQDLYSLTGETSHLAVRDGRDALYLIRFYGTRRVARSSWTGGRLPLHSTAVGKVLLAYEEPWVQNSFLEGRLDPETKFTVGQPQRLVQEWRTTVARGYATTLEEQRVGTCSIAVPIFHTGRIGAALGLVLPAHKHASLTRHLPTLQAVSVRIEKATAHIPLETLLRASEASLR